MSLEIVLGPMFSGKTSYALSYIRRLRAVGRNVVAVKPVIDTRFSQDEIVSHNRDKIPCIVWDSNVVITAHQVMLEADSIVIEEAQFFKGLYIFCEYMLKLGKHILLIGLDGDARQQPFREILDCIPLANRLTKLSALCRECHGASEAYYTRYKKTSNKSTSQVDVGGAEKYEAVCFKCLHKE